VVEFLVSVAVMGKLYVKLPTVSVVAVRQRCGLSCEGCVAAG
jgi:hypothetical protein